MNRECEQSVATDDRITFTDKDKVRRIQTLGNDKEDACWTAKVAFIRVRINVSLIFISLGLVMSGVMLLSVLLRLHSLCFCSN